MAPAEPLAPRPMTLSHTESRVDQRMGPCWVATTPKGSRLDAGSNGSEGVWESGPSGELRAHCIRVMDSARDVICLSSFLLADEEIRAGIASAFARGVRVYLLTATEQRLLSTISQDDEFSERARDQHMQMLDELALRTLLRSGEDLHAKYLIVDPRGGSPKGVVLTCNLTSEGFTRNPELAVDVSGEEASDLFRLFLWGFWKQSKRELLDRQKITGNAAYVPHGVSPPQLLPCTVEGSTKLRDEMLRLIHGSEKELWVSAYKFTRAHPTTASLEEAARRGVRVRLLASLRPARGHMDALVSLARAGVEVRGLRYLHGKVILSDIPHGPQALVMSANFDPEGLDQGYEAGVSLSGKRLDALRRTVTEWWGRATHALLVDKNLGELPDGEARFYREGTDFEDATVATRFERDLGSITAPDLDKMATVRPARFPLPERSGTRTYYKELQYTWTVLPPQKAKPAGKPTDAPS